jgi:hypothetical protein
MQNIKAVFPNNQSFVWTLDFSQLAALYDNISSWVVRMQIKTYPTDASPLYEWVTGGAQGTVTYNASAQTMTFLAAQSAMAAIVGLKYFDIRVEDYTAGEAAVAFGTINFLPGVTMSGSSAANSALATFPDTVFCQQSQTLASPGAPPVSPASISSSASAAESAAAAAAASEAAAQAALAAIPAAVAAAIAAAVGGPGVAAALAAWLAALPMSLPGSAGVWWIDGGVLARS